MLIQIMQMQTFTSSLIFFKIFVHTCLVQFLACYRFVFFCEKSKLILHAYHRFCVAHILAATPQNSIVPCTVSRTVPHRLETVIPLRN
jgi:hypothetical protein